MKISISADRQIVLEKIPPLLADWIENIPRIIFEGSDSSGTESRFFPSPAQEEDICADWKAHVQPELYTWFEFARSVVSEDVKSMKLTGEDRSLRFPLAHSDGWINALNQVRLVLAEKHHLTEKELGEHRQASSDPEIELLLFQMDFYAEIQCYLIDLMENSS